MIEWKDHKTVGDFIDALSAFPRDWKVSVATPAGGGVAIEHREIGGKPVIAIFGNNGGRFGENPLTEDEYKKKSAEFLRNQQSGMVYTSAHGDHRLYTPSLGSQASCYGWHYDGRIVERMVQEGLIEIDPADIERVRYLERRAPPSSNNTQGVRDG